MNQVENLLLDYGYDGVVYLPKRNQGYFREQRLGELNKWK